MGSEMCIRDSSNWDIINGGANEALAETLKLNVISPFDKTTNIGRICKTDKSFGDFEKDILDYAWQCKKLIVTIR